MHESSKAGHAERARSTNNAYQHTTGVGPAPALATVRPQKNWSPKNGTITVGCTEENVIEQGMAFQVGTMYRKHTKIVIVAYVEYVGMCAARTHL
jgi:hypothetical protein